MQLRIHPLKLALAATVALMGLGGYGVAVSPPKKAPIPNSNLNEKVSFYHQIRPILQAKCQGCHQPNVRSGHLMLISYADFLKGGVHGPAFVKGHPEKSLVIGYLEGKPELMPQGGPPLSKAEIGLFRRWIAQGALDDTPAEHSAYNATHPPLYTVAPLISALAYSPDGKTLAVSAYHEVLLLNSQTGALQARLVGDAQRLTSLVFTPDSKMLIAVGGTPARYGEVQFWDVATHRLLNKVRFTYDTLFGASLSPDGKHLAFGGADNTVRVVDVPDGKQLMMLENDTDWVFGTVFSRDGQYVVSASRDEALKLTQVQTGSFIDDINTHTTPMRCMVGRPGQDQVLCGGDDGIPRLYKIFRTEARTMNNEDHNLIRAFERQPSTITALAFHPSGNLCAVASETGSVNLYDVNTGAKVLSLPPVNGALFALAFTSDGKILATAGFDGYVRYYNVSTGQLLRAFVPVPLQKPNRSAFAERGKGYHG